MDMQTGAWSERVSGREPVYNRESGGREVGEQLGIVVFVGLDPADFAFHMKRTR